MLTPNGSGEGAGACCSSSRKIYCCTGVQPVPPYSFGQCETAQPFLFRMRVHSTSSCLLVWRPSFSFSRIAGGRFSLKKVRTSSRNLSSSSVKRRSMACTPEDRLVDFEQTSSPHAAADAHCHHDTLGAAPFAFDESVAGQPRAAHSIGRAHGDCAAIHIELLRIDAEPVAAIDHLHGESFVQFPEIDIGNFESVPLQESRNGKYRADAHLIGLAACRDKAAERAERLQAFFLGEFRVHDTEGRRTIGQLAGIARSHCLAFTAHR